MTDREEHARIESQRKRKGKERKRRINFKRPPAVRIDESKIKFKDSVRYLGVHFDSSCESNHIANI